MPDLASYSIDGVVPAAVEAPSGRTDLSRTVRQAAAGKLSVFPRGGGTQMALGNRPDRVDLVIDLSRLDRMLDYQPADMTVTVEAGITLAALQRELAEAGKFLPLESPLPERATIGGILSTGFTGPLAHAYGPPRDWLIGIGVLGADGIETKAGGKVVKNVTGYDLNKLYTGALGTLGIIVEATFKVAPLQPESAALTARFPSVAAAIDAGQALLDAPAAPVAYVATRPQDGSPVSRLASVSAGVAFFSGRARATERRIGDCIAALDNAGAIDVTRLDTGESNALRQGLTNLAWETSPPALALRVSVPRRNVAAMTAACLDLGGPEIVADPGFGAVRLYWWDDPGGAALLRYTDAVRAAARSYDGAAVVERAPISLKQTIDVWGEEPDSFAIMRRVKEQFDPAVLLNPGRFMGRL